MRRARARRSSRSAFERFFVSWLGLSRGCLANYGQSVSSRFLMTTHRTLRRFCSYELSTLTPAPLPRERGSFYGLSLWERPTHESAASEGRRCHLFSEWA